MELSRVDIEAIVRRVLEERDAKARVEEAERKNKEAEQKYKRTLMWSNRLMGAMIGFAVGLNLAWILDAIKAHH
jgi:hypothetical protein